MMQLIVEGAPPLAKSELVKITEFVCCQEDPDNDYQISLLIVQDDEMKRYNKLYRGIEEATDILSFVTASIPKDIDNPESLTTKTISPNKNKHQGVHNTPLHSSTKLVICDILIDINQLVRQKGNRSLEDEFRIVFLHGLLHLYGYDHIRKSEAIIMSNKEDIYLKQLKVNKISGRR